MRRLPSLLAGRGCWLLPMADASAALLIETVLIETLLADQPAAGVEPLREMLAGDPPLALWTACLAGRRAEGEPGSLAALARWLADSALQALQWKTDHHVASGEDEADTPALEAFADRVAADVERAELAARLCPQDHRPTVERALLWALLDGADDWLAATGPAVSQGKSNPLPDWLKAAGDAAEAEFVRRARAALAGEASWPESVDVDREALRRLGQQARARWLAPVAAVGDWLPALTAKLARLAQLETDFQHALETEKLEAMAEFAAGAGHEINNPLTVIAGRAQLFLGEESDPERRRALALMNAQAMRIHEMIADMMLFARPPQPEFDRVELVELVDALLEQLRPEAGRQEITLRRRGVDGPVPVDADPVQLAVALRAICQNGMEAIGREGLIEVDVQSGPGEAVLRVADDGPGITDHVRRHIFDPYYSARDAGRGLGLGLSKAWRIVTNHGGRIDVEGRPGRGAVFTITLPRRPAEVRPR